MSVCQEVDGETFSSPIGLCLDRLDNVYIADSGRNRIVKFYLQWKGKLIFILSSLASLLEGDSHYLVGIERRTIFYLIITLRRCVSLP
jgi:hypothetical protein